MPTRNIIRLTALAVFSFFLENVVAQNLPTHKVVPPEIKNLIITYDIKAQTSDKKTTLADLYDGGSKTVFISDKLARVRLVSLMRVESIYFFPVKDTSRLACLVKESGKNKFRKYFGQSEWKVLNSKYDSTDCEFLPDTLTLLNFPCHKAIIKLKNEERSISVYYTDSLNQVNSIIEPAFACIPGVVLQYTYEFKNSTATYTANSISFKKPDPKIFAIPSKGYKEVK
jgi:hypothetical protein